MNISATFYLVSFTLDTGHYTTKVTSVIKLLKVTLFQSIDPLPVPHSRESSWSSLQINMLNLGPLDTGHPTDL